MQENYWAVLEDESSPKSEKQPVFTCAICCFIGNSDRFLNCKSCGKRACFNCGISKLLSTKNNSAKNDWIINCNRQLCKNCFKTGIRQCRICTLPTKQREIV